MPQYSDADYWNKRYSEEEDSPFDWLFCYEEIKEILEFLIPDKSSDLLLIGAGNAPFSPDLNKKGDFKNITNIDLSDVVIKQQAEKFPDQKWLTMDALHLTFPDKSFPVVVDKSLIDTLMCETQSATKCAAMIREAYRVLQPGGRYISFSLHAANEVDFYYQAKEYNWQVTCFHVKSSRWDEGANRKRAVAHTMIVCDMPDHEGRHTQPFPLQIPTGTLSSDEFQRLTERAKEAVFKGALNMASDEFLLCALFHAMNNESATRQLKLALLVAAHDALRQRRREEEAEAAATASEEGEGEGDAESTASSDEDSDIAVGEVFDPENLYNTLDSPVYFSCRRHLEGAKAELFRKVKDFHKQFFKSKGNNFLGPYPVIAKKRKSCIH